MLLFQGCTMSCVVRVPVVLRSEVAFNSGELKHVCGIDARRTWSVIPEASVAMNQYPQSSMLASRLIHAALHFGEQTPASSQSNLRTCAAQSLYGGNARARDAARSLYATVNAKEFGVILVLGLTLILAACPRRSFLDAHARSIVVLFIRSQSVQLSHIYAPSAIITDGWPAQTVSMPYREDSSMDLTS